MPISHASLNTTNTPLPMVNRTVLHLRINPHTVLRTHLLSRYSEVRISKQTTSLKRPKLQALPARSITLQIRHHSNSKQALPILSYKC